VRHVVAYELVSLDGVAEEPGAWMFDVDDEVFANLARTIGRQDTVLLGRGTHDYWADYWPTSDVQPFADFINGTAKIVYTSRDLDTAWANTTVVRTGAEAHVAGLRASEGGDIGLHGSLALFRSLLAADLVDELRLVVVPTVAGRGRRLFADGAALRRFELRSATSSPTGAVFLHYARRPD
jgi:dihydrofolate reductase